ncbi:MAG: hypothetical protein HYZ75_08940 [Elusimicrobia bacterium]|nr:hypothetical protein [Elusimicrobiota bacterium]
MADNAPPDAADPTKVDRFRLAAALVVLGALAALGVVRYKRTVVSFEDFNVRTDVVLDHGPRLTLEGRPGDHLRRSLTAIRPGKHLLYYDVSSVTRYYAPIVVKRGENTLRPRFTYHAMPGTERNVSHEKGAKNDAQFFETLPYATYAADGTRLERKAEVTLRIRSAPEDKGKARWSVSWKVVLDGQAVVEKTEEFVHSGKDGSDVVETVGWQDDRHYWRQRSFVSPMSIQTAVDSAYIEYK